MQRRTAVVVLAGLVVVLTLVLLALVVAPQERRVPCVDHVPANVSCAPDSPLFSTPAVAGPSRRT